MGVAGVMRVTAASMSHDLAIEMPFGLIGKSAKQPSAVSRQISLCAESVSSMQVRLLTKASVVNTVHFLSIVFLLTITSCDADHPLFLCSW
jgi:hypothetical protein